MYGKEVQPAEAEGTDVPVVAYQSRETGEFYEQSYGLDRPLELVLRSDHLAALSAVTAERDRLQAALDDPGYQPKHARRLIAQLRAEVEALRAFVTDCTETAGGMVNGNRLSRRAKELIAAMAAKEA